MHPSSPGTADPDRAPVIRAWLLLSAVLLATVLVPFVLWEEAIAGWSTSTLTEGTAPAWAAAAVAGLLATDLALPVPSSLVSTWAGYRFGIVGGAALSWAGMSVGCVVAYALGRRWGTGAARRLVGAGPLDRVSGTVARRGAWALAVFRPVPVLAEASVLLAGLTRMDPARFLLVTLPANLGISLAYAWVGARSARSGSFLLAFAGAMLLPLLAAAAARAWHPRESGEAGTGSA